MLFFNKKEEVLDIKLTQYGKHLLSKGSFRPQYYCFFDDDILYDASKAGISESQNASEERILNNTPKLKTQYLTYGVETYNVSDEVAESFELIYGSSQPQYFDFNLQNRSLLYPVGNQEVLISSAPSYDVLPVDSSFVGAVSYQHFTSSGIIKNVPQLSSSVDYFLVRDTRSRVPANSPRNSGFTDFELNLEADVMNFSDNTNLHITKSSLTLDIEESNSYDGKKNFFLEIYEIFSDQNNIDRLVKLSNPQEIRKLFKITTDSSVDPETVQYKTKKQRNNRKRGE